MIIQLYVAGYESVPRIKKSNPASGLRVSPQTLSYSTEAGNVREILNFSSGIAIQKIDFFQKSFFKSPLYKKTDGVQFLALMNILGISWLGTSIAVLTTIYIFVCASMIFLILLQRPKQEGLGAAFGANTAGEIFGSRVTSVLQRGTVYLASSFFLLTLILAILVQKKNTELGKLNLIDKTEAVATVPEASSGQPVSLQSEVPVEVPSTVNTEPVSVAPDSTATPEGNPTTEDAANVLPPDDKPAQEANSSEQVVAPELPNTAVQEEESKQQGE